METPAPLSLVLGGARSGKSRHAEAMVRASGLAPVYVATAEAGDAEMAARIAEHRARRGPEWTNVEAARDLAGALAAHGAPGRVVLVDCLTLWLSNLLLDERDWSGEADSLAAALKAAAGPVVLVSNEVGLGLVPETPLGRRFRDAQGALNQRMAGLCQRVDFVAAGLAVRLKP